MQWSENTRKNSVLNYETAALPAELRRHEWRKHCILAAGRQERSTETSPSVIGVRNRALARDRKSICVPFGAPGGRALPSEDHGSANVCPISRRAMRSGWLQSAASKRSMGSRNGSKLSRNVW